MASKTDEGKEFTEIFISTANLEGKWFIPPGIIYKSCCTSFRNASEERSVYDNTPREIITGSYSLGCCATGLGYSDEILPEHRITINRDSESLCPRLEEAGKIM